MTRAEALTQAADAWRAKLAAAEATEARLTAARETLCAAELPFWARLPTDAEKATLAPLRAAEAEASRAHASACRERGQALDALLAIAAAPSDLSP